MKYTGRCQNDFNIQGYHRRRSPALASAESPGPSSASIAAATAPSTAARSPAGSSASQGGAGAAAWAALVVQNHTRRTTRSPSTQAWALESF